MDPLNIQGFCDYLRGNLANQHLRFIGAVKKGRLDQLEIIESFQVEILLDGYMSLSMLHSLVPVVGAYSKKVGNKVV
jgi:hypothetical protein